MTKIFFIKAPVVHLIADTQVQPSVRLIRDLRLRGADLSEDLNNIVTCTLPTNGNHSTGAERLCEFAGKLCYNAFGKNGSTKTTEQYLNDSVYSTSQDNPFGHLSIAYHANFSLYISGISRSLSHELLRHYIGVSASQGSPSQMSTRYVVHPARFVVPPKYLEFLPEGSIYPVGASTEAIQADIDTYNEYQLFKKSCKSAYRYYAKMVASVEGKKGIAKKRVLEAAARMLPQATETSLVLTLNPISARKMIVERTSNTADFEFARLAFCMQKILEARYKAFKFR